MNALSNESIAIVKKEFQIERAWQGHLLWALAGAMLAFAIAAVFAGLFHLPRAIYLIPYTLFIIAFLYGYVYGCKPALDQFISKRWGWGLVAGIVVSVFGVQSVLLQPGSPSPQGFQLVIDLLWLGIVYGTVDGLLLSVLPVFAVQQAMAKLGWATTWRGRVGTGILALIVSMVVIAVYHLGYPEFRGTQVALPVFGVGVMSLAYIITGNPISAVLSHVAMHIAAVLHGMQTVVQLPPHY